MTASMREIRLPDELCQAAEQRFGHQFSSLEELVAFVLRELLRDDASQMDEAETRVIEERLRDLGYI